MPNFPTLLQIASRFEAAGVDLATSAPVIITGGATANALNGTYTQIIASTAFDATGIVVNIHRDGGADIDGLLNIAIGAASSEVVILESLGWYRQSAEGTSTYYFPIRIKSGSRISANARATTGGSNPKCQVILLQGSFFGSGAFNGVTTYGHNTADSGGTSIDPGATAHTEGAWFEIIASSTNPIRQLSAYVGPQQVARVAADFLLDIGIGTTELVLSDLYFRTEVTVDYLNPHVIGPLPFSVPTATRLAARARSSTTSATARLFDIILYGIY